MIPYSDVLIAPALIDGLDTVSGKRGVPAGEIALSYEKRDGRIELVITIPTGVKATFRFAEVEQVLNVGENRITVAI